MAIVLLQSEHGGLARARWLAGAGGATAGDGGDRGVGAGGGGLGFAGGGFGGCGAGGAGPTHLGQRHAGPGYARQLRSCEQRPWTQKPQSPHLYEFLPTPSRQMPQGQKRGPGFLSIPPIFSRVAIRALVGGFESDFLGLLKGVSVCRLWGDGGGEPAASTAAEKTPPRGWARKA